MIKAQELRLGNWYNDKRINRDFVVQGITQRYIDHGDTDYSSTSIANAIGIPLTSEWLERFGWVWES